MYSILNSKMIDPHGGRLINQKLTSDQISQYLEGTNEMHTVKLSKDCYDDLENIAHGIFSPLTGFMTKAELDSIIDNDRLPNGAVWTIPILLDSIVDEKCNLGSELLLAYGGEPVAVLKVEDIFDFKNDYKKEVAKHVFGTTEDKHPGVNFLYKLPEKLMGGEIKLIKEQKNPHSALTKTPAETRKIFEEKGWKTVVGFQTRNVPHLGHEFVQKASIVLVDGLFVNPLIGRKKAGDFLDDVILGAYEVLMENYYVKEKSYLAALKTRMRYGGPKEAIHHAIMRKNFGCTHFIVGRDHAGVGKYYGPYDAHEIFDEFPDLGITPIKFRAFSYCKRCYSVVSASQCPHPPEDHILFSGTKIRGLLNEKKIPEKLMMRPEVAAFMVKQDKLFVE